MLRTLNDLQTADENALPSIASEILSLGILSDSAVSFLLRSVRSEGFECPTPDFVVNYVIAFLLEHLEDITWRCQNAEEAGAFSDPQVWIFRWENRGLYRLIFLDDAHKETVTSILTAAEAGVTLPHASMVSLQADTENITRYHNLLEQLDLIPRTSTETIPTLSDTMGIDESTARFSSAIWYENIQKKVIILAGLGGIGSYVAFLLARMHPTSIFLYDDDKVELVNMAGQLYCLQDVGKYKVDAIAHTITSYSSYSSAFAVRERFTDETESSDIMICGFDNMEARETFFNSWLAHVNSKPSEEREHCLFIDGRLAAEELQVLCIRGDDSYNIERYNNEFLFSDSEADETLCSYKQTTYMANMIGSIIVNLFTNFVANELVANLRDLPFFTSYSAITMTLKCEQ